MTDAGRTPKAATQHARHARRNGRTSSPADTRPRTDRPTMRDVQHTHPYTGESFQTAYTRGPVVSDGGRGGDRGPEEVANPSPRSDEADSDGDGGGDGDNADNADDADAVQPAEAAEAAEQAEGAETADQVQPADLDGEMRDVDHTPPDDEEGANRVWERGAESKDRHR